MSSFDDDPIMEDVHKIREELEQQFVQSGLSFSEWLVSTEKEFSSRLAEVGFKVITKDNLQCLVSI